MIQKKNKREENRKEKKKRKENQKCFMGQNLQTGPIFPLRSARTALTAQPHLPASPAHLWWTVCLARGPQMTGASPTSRNERGVDGLRRLRESAADRSTVWPARWTIPRGISRRGSYTTVDPPNVAGSPVAFALPVRTPLLCLLSSPPRVAPYGWENSTPVGESSQLRCAPPPGRRAAPPTPVGW